MFVLLVLLTFVAALTIDYLVQRADQRREAAELRLAAAGATAATGPITEASPAPASATSPAPALAPPGIPRAHPAEPNVGALGQLPAGLFLAPGHDWLQVEQSGSVRLGTDRLALALLGGVDRLELLPAGSVVHPGDPLATLHFGERSIVLRAPIEGVIDEVNTLVGADPQRLARDPFEEGWLYRLHARSLAEALRGMKVAEEAAAWMGSEVARIRDFATGLGQGGRVAATFRPGAAGATSSGGAPTAETSPAMIPLGLAKQLPARDWKRLVDRFYAAG